MPIEQRLAPVPLQAGAEQKYFVGRRTLDDPEIYEVTVKGVRRLRPRRRSVESNFDWSGSAAARMELSRLLISRVAARRPSRDLQARFALYVLANLPEAGFVLDSDQFLRWLRLASDPQDFAPARPRPSWAGRVRARLRSTAIRETHD